ncbi:MAG: hypothetical protein RR757_05365, partial [Raoultibacter sp.]
MEKDPKKSGSLAASHAADVAGATPDGRSTGAGNLVAHKAGYVTAVKEVKSLFGQGFIKLNFFTLFWL